MEKTLKPVPDVEALRYKGTPEKPDIKIFVSHRIDLDSETIDNPLYIPVRCGAVYDERENVEMLGDDTGESISEKRDSYCELTVLYWAWKNVKADYYGLCHYRRYFSFTMDDKLEDFYGNVAINDFDELHEFVDSLDETQEIIRQNDIIVTRAYDVAIQGFHSLYEQYGATPSLKRKDLEKAVDILKREYPECADIAEEYMNGTVFFPCNMVIMERKVFMEYCEWLFSILSIVEKEIDTSQYSVEGKRAVGHIAERFMGIFYLWKREKNSVKTKEQQRVVVMDTSPITYPEPAFKLNNVPIVFVCSDYFVPYVSVTLQSLISSSSYKNNYDIIIINRDITKQNQSLLKKMFAQHENFSLRFLNVSRLVKPLNTVKSAITSVGHVSVETLYRLLAPNIFKYYDKVVYLDSDLIILRDVAELFYLDIGTNLIAATVDVDHAGEYNGAIPGVYDFSKNVLNLKNPYEYFQAGVLVLNITQFNRTFTQKEILELAQRQEYIYADQDILNILCSDRVHYLELNWNILTDCLGIRVDRIIRMAPAYLYDMYMERRKEPYIIHFAGAEKPWTNALTDFADIFWEYARMTPFYEAIIWRMCYQASKTTNMENAGDSVIISTPRRIANRIIPLGTKRREIVKRILPRKGSKAWLFMKKVYYSVFEKKKNGDQAK